MLGGAQDEWQFVRQQIITSSMFAYVRGRTMGIWGDVQDEWQFVRQQTTNFTVFILLRGGVWGGVDEEGQFVSRCSIEVLIAMSILGLCWPCACVHHALVPPLPPLSFPPHLGHPVNGPDAGHTHGSSAPLPPLSCPSLPFPSPSPVLPVPHLGHPVNSPHAGLVHGVCHAFVRHLQSTHEVRVVQHFIAHKSHKPVSWLCCKGAGSEPLLVSAAQQGQMENDYNARLSSTSSSTNATTEPVLRGFKWLGRAVWGQVLQYLAAS